MERSLSHYKGSHADCKRRNRREQREWILYLVASATFCARQGNSLLLDKKSRLEKTCGHSDGQSHHSTTTWRAGYFNRFLRYGTSLRLSRETGYLRAALETHHKEYRRCIVNDGSIVDGRGR